MPTTYPPAAPTLSGDVISISRFLQNPTLVARRLRTLLEQRYIADVLLQGRYVVSDAFRWAHALSAFVNAGWLPRESLTNNPALTGQFPEVGGMRWLPTPNLPVAATAFVLDSSLLGGMADEDLGGPGYVNVNGV